MTPMSEQELQQGIIQLARLLGFRVAHFRAARTNKGWRTPVGADGKGFPDLVCVHEQTGRLVFAELKREGGKTSDEQLVWADALAKVALANPGIEYHLWTPHDWPDRITEVLSGRAVREVA